MELLLLHQFLSFYVHKYNLHSNMELLLLVYSFFLSVSTKKFTFQYGATTTQVAEQLLIKIKEFTFQYGATTTPNMMEHISC